MKKFLRTVFIVLMLLCTGVLIWHAAASTMLNRTIAAARDDLDHEQRLLHKQVESDHVEALDEIRTWQSELDILLTPELDELWRHEQTIKTLKSEKSELQSEITSKKSEKKELEKLLRNPASQTPETPETDEPEAPDTDVRETEPQETESLETEGE